MYAAQRLATLTESVIREMTRFSNQHGAINLSQGFPDFDPPSEVLAAATEALQSGQNQYAITWGLPALRQKVAEKYQRWYGMTVNPDTDITVTCGVSEAIIASLMAVVNPGDRVIIIEPYHENYIAGVRFAGGEPVWVRMAPPDFDLNEDELRAAFAQRPKAILINTPHNPTGRVYDRKMLQLLADLCIAYDTVAITDEIYEHIVYDGREHIPLATLPGMAERTITLSGLTKTYAATGWRVAWAVAPPQLSKAVRTVHDFTTVCAPTPLQAAAAAALSLPDSYYTNLAATYHARRDAIMTILAEASFRAQKPEGAYYVMADYSAIQPEMDEMTFARWLITEKKVAVVPGSSFYHSTLDRGGIVRFAFAKRLETLEAARQKLAGA
jgi:aminotransferase